MQRQIIRRAIRHGYKLGQKTPFFTLVADASRLMGRCLPCHPRAGTAHYRGAWQEEERFFETLANGYIPDAARRRHGARRCGLQAARYLRFPLTWTNDVAERGVEVDEAGFRTAMEKAEGAGAPQASSRWTRRWTTLVPSISSLAMTPGRYCKNRSNLASMAQRCSPESRSKKRCGGAGHDLLRRKRRSGRDEGTLTSGSAWFCGRRHAEDQGRCLDTTAPPEEGTLNVGDTGRRR